MGGSKTEVCTEFLRICRTHPIPCRPIHTAIKRPHELPVKILDGAPNTASSRIDSTATWRVDAFLAGHTNVHLHFTPPTPRGSTKSNSGSRRLNAR